MNLKEALERAQFQPGVIGAKRFREGTTSVTTPGQRSRLARIEAPAARALLPGKNNPFKLALPAYEGKTTDGTADNAETFSLSYNLIESPNTTDLVLYEGGERVSPDSVDYGANSFDYTSAGTGTSLHVFYTTDAAGEIQLIKSAPDGKADSSLEIDSVAAHHLARQDQVDQPYTLTFDSGHEGFVPTDFALEIYVEATYPVALEDPDGDGATADNALYQLPVNKAQGSIPGLRGAVRDAMSQG
jgi:hypothetical protein